MAKTKDGNLGDSGTTPSPLRRGNTSRRQTSDVGRVGDLEISYSPDGRTITLTVKPRKDSESSRVDMIAKCIEALESVRDEQGKRAPQYATEKIEAAVKAFRKDLPALLEQHPGKWVAYHGGEQFGIAEDDADLYRDCYKQGWKLSEFIVERIEPQTGNAMIMGPAFIQDKTTAHRALG